MEGLGLERQALTTGLIGGQELLMAVGVGKGVKQMKGPREGRRLICDAGISIVTLENGQLA